MNSSNENLIFISLGIDNPIEFMEEAYKKASKLILEVPENGS